MGVALSWDKPVKLHELSRGPVRLDLAPSPEQRAAFMTNPRFAAPAAVRATHIGKALIGPGPAGHVSPREALRLRARGMLIRGFGRLTPDFERFMAARADQRWSAQSA